MKSETGTRFMDWIDYIQLAARSKFVPRLKSTGFIQKPEWDGEGAICWVQPHGVFPIILVRKEPRAAELEVGIKVDSVSDFAATNQMPLRASDFPLSPLRQLLIQARDEAIFYAVERPG